MRAGTDRHLAFLRSVIRDLSRPLEPIATGVAPWLSILPGLRACVFDVYGTLLISGSGEVGTSAQAVTEDLIREAFDEARIETFDAAAPRAAAELYYEVIGLHHERRRATGVEFPEVDIREVWQDVFRELRAKALVKTEIDRECAERLSVSYECRINPTALMPGFPDILAALRSTGVALGIVSNAQFFTPLIMEELAGAGLTSLGFLPERTAFSYESLEAKPSASMFRLISKALSTSGIDAEEILYVGNDVRNDVIPAASTGMKTALFAGDRRSYRPRSDDPSSAGGKPDRVITSLGQIGQIFGI